MCVICEDGMTSYRMLYCCVLRVVLDTSVMAAALRSRTGASFLVLRAVQLRRLVLLATASLFLEYEDVLKRDEQREVSGFTLGDVDELLYHLRLISSGWLSWATNGSLSRG